ncbi:MAG: hypothetical protein GF309_06955 [Candidatus Lokiarchaeota archaeon]|nr:hypothetical protein [Candidatus Lokiarchaeota archaeon]
MEYVTQNQYDIYQDYVAQGGRLFINDACSFLCEVGYGNGYMWLVKGKGFAFNGTHAWKSVYRRWPLENQNWVGSNFNRFHYGTVPWNATVNASHPVGEHMQSHYGSSFTTSYRGHEENYISNVSETTMILQWKNALYDRPIAVYEHDYQNGTVLHTGIMLSEVMYNDLRLMRLFISLLRYALQGAVSEWTFPVEANIQARENP